MRCNNIKLADSLRRMVQEECIETHGVNAWTEHPDEKTLIRPILIARAIKERKENPDIFCENLFEFGCVKANCVNVLTDLRYPNELEYISKEIPYENRFHIWVNRGEAFGPVGEEEEKYTTQLRKLHDGMSNAVVYNWDVDMLGAGWSVWDKNVRSSVEKNVTDRIMIPVLLHFGLSHLENVA